MLKVVTAEEIANIDKRAIQDFGISAEILMGFAGKSVFQRLLRFMPKQPVIVAGKGNNGGDGLVIAHFLQSENISPELILLWQPENFSETAKYYWNILTKQNISISILETGQSFFELLKCIEKKSKYPLLLIDALFGTGLAKPLTGRFAELSEDWNKYQKNATVKVAIDIPSGINGSGVNLGDTYLKSQYTYTMGLPKIGLFTYPGKAACGSIEVINIGFPNQLLQSDEIAGGVLNEDDFYNGSPFLPPALSMLAHKYTRGVAVIIGGSEGMEGAPLLVADGAVLAGAGLVKILTKKQCAVSLAGKRAEIQVYGLDENEIKDQLIEILTTKKSIAIAIGPGLGRNKFSRKILENVFQVFSEKRELLKKIPVILDADALTLLPEIFSLKDFKNLFCDKLPIIATPHFGELKKFFGKGSPEQKKALENYKKDKIGCITQLARLTKLTLLAKGIDTVISDPGGKFFINPTGNPNLAKGGSGDILTGLILGFSAQGLEPLVAATSAAYLLGRASDELLKDNGIYLSGSEFIFQYLKKIVSKLGKKEKNNLILRKWDSVDYS